MPPIAPSEIMEPLLSKIPLRSKTVEHPFGTIKAWMGATHFKMKTLRHVATEMALHVLAYHDAGHRDLWRVGAGAGDEGMMEAHYHAVNATKVAQRLSGKLKEAPKADSR